MIAGGAAAFAMVLVGIQTWRLGNSQEEIGELKAKIFHQVAQTQQAVGVNVTLNTQLDGLATRIADMVEARRLEREEQDRVLAARDEDLAAAVDEARRLEGERDVIFRSTLSCAELGSTRVDLACPAIADQLRQRTHGGSGDRDPDSGSPGGSGTTRASSTHESDLVPAAAG